MTKNAFGMNIPRFKTLLENEKVSSHIRTTLENVLVSLDVEGANILTNAVIQMASVIPSQEMYEMVANRILSTSGANKEVVQLKLGARSDVVYAQIKPYIKPGKLIDLGCGDGKIGKRISQDGLNVTLADVYEHPNIIKTGLDFKYFKQGQEVPFIHGIFDNVLLLTVMHHADNPVATMKEAYRLAKSGGRVIAIESVYGVKSEDVPLGSEKFAKLNTEEQRLSNIFFDHFYNRIIHHSIDTRTKVNVPYNFNTPQK